MGERAAVDFFAVTVNRGKYSTYVGTYHRAAAGCTNLEAKRWETGDDVHARKPLSNHLFE